MVVQMVFDPVIHFTVGTVSFLFEHILASFDLHKRINQLRAEVNGLQKEVSGLRNENARLEKNTKELKQVKAQLNQVSILQGQTVKELIQQVSKYKEIQQEVKETLQAKVIQNLVSVVIHADDDKDFTIDPGEIDELMLRLKAIDGVDFCQENFFKALRESSGHDPKSLNTNGEGYKIKVVLDVMKNLVDEDVPEEENIFTLHTERVLITSK